MTDAVPLGREMPSLVPIEEPYDDDLRSELLKHLQTRGYCVLLDVWERDSVSVYERRIRTLAGPGARFGVHANAIPEERRADTWWLPNDCPEFIEPIRAPRIRSMLPAALIPSPHPRSKIQCFEQVIHPNYTSSPDVVGRSTRACTRNGNLECSACRPGLSTLSKKHSTGIRTTAIVAASLVRSSTTTCTPRTSTLPATTAT